LRKNEIFKKSRSNPSVLKRNLYNATMSRRVLSKASAISLSAILFLQSLAPLAYAYQGGPTGPVQQANPVVVPGDDPTDTVIPDLYLDLPTVYPTPGNLGFNSDRTYIWDSTTLPLLEAIDYENDPVDPAVWAPPLPPVGIPQKGIHNLGIIAWERAQGGSITGGGGLINPPIGSGGTSGSGTGTGAGGSVTGTRGEISGQVNTNTGFVDLSVPIVSFGGKGAASVDLSMSVKQWNPVTSGQRMWKDNYDVRLDMSTQAGQAIITMANGTALPFTKISGASGLNIAGTYQGPMGIRATLIQTTLGYSELAWRNGDKWRFSANASGNPVANGRLTNIAYRKGGSVAINRNTSTGSVTITTGSRTATIQYGGTSLPSGTAIRITAPNGVTNINTEYLGNYAGQVPTTVVYPGGLKTVKFVAQQVLQTTSGPPFGNTIGLLGVRVTGFRDGKNNLYSYQYDAYERLYRVINPQNKFTTYDYAIPGKTKITNEDGKVSYDLYENGSYTGHIDEAGFTTSMVRNAEHDIVSSTNERGQTWTINRNANGDALSVTNPQSKTSTYTYNSFGQVLTKTTPLGATTTFNYEPTKGLLTSVVDPLGRTSLTATYDSDGQPQTVKDALNRTTTLGYNTEGDVTSVQSPEGLISTTLVNNLGLPTQTTDPANRTTTITYDALYRVTQIAGPTGITSKFWYDANDNVIKVWDGLNRESLMTYDNLDNLITSKNPRNDNETYEYDVLSQLKAVTNGRGKRRTYQYTPRGEMKYSYLPDGTTETYGYFADGSLSTFISPGRGAINYGYDPCGRLSLVDYASMTDTTFTYDDSGRRIAMVDGTGQTSWFYDAANQLTTLNQAGKVTSYGYNPAGERTSMVQPAGTTTYNYDTFGRLQSLVNPQNETTSFGYDNISRLSSKVLSSGLREEYTYDSIDRLQQMLTRNTAGVVNHNELYTYNNASEVTSHMVDGDLVTYGYDAASQLTSEVRPGYNVGYTYDGNGNRLTKTLNGSVEAYTYDDGDKMITAGNKSYQYDLAGRTTRVTGSNGITNLTYDDEDRLKTITGAAGTHSYTYNGLDTRVGKVENGVTTNFHRDGAYVTDPVISDTNADYTPGISERRGGVTKFNHSSLKSITAQSNTAQVMTATRTYDAFGAVISGNGTWSGSFGYAGGFGYQEDASGLKLLGHRYLDSSTGRFLTRDPVEDGRNWFSYCDNNPVDSFDDNGFQKKKINPPAGLLGGPGKGPTVGAPGVPAGYPRAAPAAAAGAADIALGALGKILGSAGLLFCPETLGEDFHREKQMSGGGKYATWKANRASKGGKQNHRQSKYVNKSVTELLEMLSMATGQEAEDISQELWFREQAEKERKERYGKKNKKPKGTNKGKGKKQTND
jgi:RHS repeat-associated protein